MSTEIAEPVVSEEVVPQVEGQEEVVETSAEDGSEQKVDEKKSSAAEKKEIQKQLKKLKIKFNGREEEVEFDPEDEEYLRRTHQLAKLGQVKSQEYSQLEKEVRSFIEELKKNPRKILEDESLGVDLKKLAAEILEEEIANSAKSPEQLEREKLESELRSLREERERERQDALEQRKQQLEEQEFERFDMLMDQAISQSDLPKSAYVVKKMADYLMYGIEKGYDISPTDVMPLVREEIQQDISDMFSTMPLDVVKKILGKETMEKLRQERVAQARKTPPANIKKETKDVASSQKQEKNSPKKTYKEFFGI